MYCRSRITAEHDSVIAMPASSSVAVSNPKRLRASPSRKSVTAAAPAKAARKTTGMASSAVGGASCCATTAPSAAPEATPRV